MKHKHWIVAGGLMLAAGAAIWTWFWAAGPTSTADPNNIAQVSLGQTVYAENCASCHGANLEGQPDWRTRKPDGRMPAPPHNESGHTWHHPDQGLFGITKNGLAAYAPAGYENDMPAFQDVLTDDEIWAALAFIKSSWPEEVLVRQTARKERAGQ